MAETSNSLSAVCNYEHRDNKGKMVSIGTTKVDWLGYYHVYQKDFRTGLVTKAIYRPDRTLRVSNQQYTLKFKLLRLVGLRKK